MCLFIFGSCTLSSRLLEKYWFFLIQYWFFFIRSCLKLDRLYIKKKNKTNKQTKTTKCPMSSYCSVCKESACIMVCRCVSDPWEIPDRSYCHRWHIFCETKLTPNWKVLEHHSVSFLPFEEVCNTEECLWYLGERL